MATSASSTAAATGTASRLRVAAGRPTLSGVVVYAVMVGVALAILIPIVYAILGGFKTNGQLAEFPARILPDPWVFENYGDVLVGKFAPTFWGELLNSVVIAAIAVTLTVLFASLAAFAFARIAFRGREAVYTLFVFGLLFPTAVAILPLYILVRAARADRQPARRGAPPGGLRAAAHDRDPPAVLPEHPRRARGRGPDRRLQLVRVLLAGPPAARPARAGHGERARRRGDVERVPPAADHPQRRGPVDAAAGGHELLDGVRLRRGEGARVHGRRARSRPSCSTCSPSGSSSAG